MSKICLVCNTHYASEIISIFRHREKLDSMLMLHWGLRATKDDYICRGCCDEVLRAFDLNQKCQQPNEHNPKVLASEATVLDAQTNYVHPTEGSILPMYIKVKAEPQSENELETKPEIFSVNVETKKIGGYVENTSEGLIDEFPIKIENLGATSGGNAGNSSESYPQYFKSEMPFDNEDSGEINQNEFGFAESGMCFVRSANLETNQRTLTGERPYECPHCSKTFITSTRLKEHKRTHTGERPYACSSCSKTYITAASLHIHIRTHMKDKPFVCSECGKSCTTSQLLKYHKRTHTGERPYACSYCPKSYITNGRLQRHMFSHRKEKREGPFECLQCSKSFKSSWALKVHIRMHAQETNASDSTQSSHQSNKQKQEVQNDEIDPEIGATPSMEVKEKDEPQDEDESKEDFKILTAKSRIHKLSKELRVDEKAEDVPEAQSSAIKFSGKKNSLSFSGQKDGQHYEICQKLFKKENSDDNNKYNHNSEFNLQHELKNGENVPEGLTQKLSSRMHKKEKPFSCLECGKSFLTTTKLQIHKRTHTGERPYKCNICLKTFVSSYKLTEHKRIHMGDKPYECRFCSKTFLRSTEVQGHERTHTKEKPYICSECGKGFVTSSVLNRHKRIHTGVKPYVCSHCAKTFTSKFYLQTHIRSHTKENLFECSDCGKSFTTSKLFQDHKMTHTGERPYACSHCSKTYINRSGLINHTRSHMKGERKRKGPYECLQCSKAFSNSCAYKVHALMHCKQENSSDFTQTPNQSNTHTETDLIAAKEAGAMDTNKSKEKLKMSESTEDWSKATDVADSRQNAEGISEGSRNYFKKEKSVDIEDKDNDQNGERFYICSYCSETFHSSRDFRIHVRNHKKDKMPDFKSHKKAHIIERSYACSYCSKTYINSDHMQKHMRIHIREKHNVEKWGKEMGIDTSQKLLQPTTYRLGALKGDEVVSNQEIDPVTTILVEDFDALGGETAKT